MHVQSTTSCPFQGYSFYTTLNLHSYHGRVGGNQLPPISLLLPGMTGRNMRPPVIYFPNWPPLRLRWGHYFRMRDHGSSLFSAVKNLHVPHPFVLTNIHTVNESSSGGKPYIASVKA